MREISLGLILLFFWLALSGHYTAFLISIGVIATLICVVLARRMGALDSEGHPTQLFVASLTYWPWLAWEVVKSAWGVTKIILHPALPISPTMTVVDASQRSAAGLVTYGNSITLTPGTITTRVDGNRLTVHALVRDGAIDLEGGGMDQRVKQFEDRA